MALIGTIRNRFGSVLVGVIAVSLLLFVANDLITPSNSGRGQEQVVGEIAGVEVPYQEFQNRVQQREENHRTSRGESPTENDRARFQQEVWNQFIYDIAFGSELNELGIDVHEEELVDLVQGNHVHAQLRQQFTNEAGMFDKNNLIQYLKFIGQTYDPQQMPVSQADFVRMQVNWQKFEKELPLTRKIEKYNALLSKSAYVTSVEAKNKYMEENSSVTAKLLYVPYLSISDSAVNVRDADLKAYLDKNQKLYARDNATITLDYVVFPVVPSKEDTLVSLDEINALKEGFASAEDDSLFAVAKADNYVPVQYSSLANVPQVIQDNYQDLDTGTVFGPILEESSYKLYKVSGIKEDSVYSARASHILFKAASKSDEDLAVALEDCKKVLREIKDGADFAEMASIHGTDGTRARGGDLGWFTEGAMVTEFNDAVMRATQTGVLPNPVKTDFGYHIIKITGVKTNLNFKIASIDREIIAGEETREEAYQKAATFSADNGTMEEFRAAAQRDSVEVLTSENMRPEDRFLRGAGNSRSTVQWAFQEDTYKGEVSDVGDLEDGYIVATLVKKSEKGTPAVDEVRDQIIAKVRNEKKAEQIKSKLASTSGGLQDKLNAYGTDASILDAPGVTMASGSLPGIGTDPVIVGLVCGMSQGEVSEPVAGANGVVVAEVTATTPATEKEDYTASKSMLLNQAKAKASGGSFEAIKDAANIEDNRVSYF